MIQCTAKICKMEESPVMCRNNCRFYANSNEENLCSMCYKDLLKKMRKSGTPLQRSSINIPEVSSRIYDKMENEFSIKSLPNTGSTAGSSTASSNCNLSTSGSKISNPHEIQTIQAEQTENELVTKSTAADEEPSEMTCKPSKTSEESGPEKN